jgi:arginyl-tRNA synthetase
LIIIKEIVEDAVAAVLAQYIQSHGLDYQPAAIKVEYPKDTKFGDYSTPVAMELARALRMNPLAIAEELVAGLATRAEFSRVEAVRPGFINLFVSDALLTSVIGEIGTLGERYGYITKKSPERVNVEFVSANPTGPLNVVSARAAAVGDTLANLLAAAGDTVEREFYINDYGNQVRLLGLSVLARYRELAGETVEFPEDGYRGEYVYDIARFAAAEHAAEVAACADDEARAAFLSTVAITYNVSGQQKVMESFRVNYNRWFSERTLHEDGSVEQTLADLESRGVIYVEDGKKVFRSTSFGDDKDRVVVREDGRPTYLLADIAYHRNKFSRGYTKVIDIWGPDHHGYIARLAGAMLGLGHDAESFKVLIAQQVNLVQNGEMVKMSKRLGQFSTMADLIEEIGADVARYFFVMRSLESHLDFDLVLAKKESSENPVFYLQYAHARICSIFREADNRGIDVTPVPATPDNDSFRALAKELAKYPEEIKDAAQSLEPHRIAAYLLRLAQSFHRFYTDNRVLTDDIARTRMLLSICGAVRTVMRNGLAIVGVQAPEKM